MKTVSDVLQTKGSDVWSIAPNATVYDALRQMADKNVGALLVLEDDKLVGILSERDYARKVILQGRSSLDTPVREIMTAKVFYVHPEQTLEDCMALMTDKRIRHLPVLAEVRIVGVISLGDVVKAVIAEQRDAIHYLESYIKGYAESTEPAP